MKVLIPAIHIPLGALVTTAVARKSRQFKLGAGDRPGSCKLLSENGSGRTIDSSRLLVWHVSKDVLIDALRTLVECTASDQLVGLVTLPSAIPNLQYVGFTTKEWCNFGDQHCYTIAESPVKRAGVYPTYTLTTKSGTIYKTGSTQELVWISNAAALIANLTGTPCVTKGENLELDLKAEVCVDVQSVNVAAEPQVPVVIKRSHKKKVVATVAPVPAAVYVPPCPVTLCAVEGLTSVTGVISRIEAAGTHEAKEPEAKKISYQETGGDILKLINPVRLSFPLVALLVLGAWFAPALQFAAGTLLGAWLVLIVLLKQGSSLFLKNIKDSTV